METAGQNRSTQQAWHAAQRWQQLDGEHRANMLRILCLAVFYCIHLGNYYQPFGYFELVTQPEPWFHQAVTALVAAWVMMAFAIFTLLRQRVFPVWFPFVTTGLDIAMVTTLLCLGGAFPIGSAM